MFRSSNRSRRHRNVPVHDEQQVPSQPFFGKSVSQTVQGKPASPFFQAKLSVNQANDPYEREADSVANAVVQKKPGIQRVCAECEKEKEEVVQQKSEGNGVTASQTLS